ncbi:DUF7289 family protein [Natronorubrum halophilum]|uniref:DUF7289 family protein n=1 Tax=Natronorubrum halophilum TaxID=1702106 RepID=UPI0010C17FB1|nr:archaellin/type IV pilin N-terminal domain-containing protein [Natronorubrum halophilum]
MFGAGGKRRGNRAQRGRGLSPIVGLVLLLGMVIAGTALLFIVGSPMLDTFESGSERERAHLCMDETDHQLATVAATGEQRSMPDTDISDCQIDVADKGQVDILWYNDSESDDLPWDDDTRTATAELGALEFELDDRTIAHQGGGIWEDTGSGTQIISEPGISYENGSTGSNGSVRFDLMLLDQDELSGSDPIARADHERSDELAADIAEAASNSDGTNVAIRIESSYHDGWKQHLDSVFGDHGHVEMPEPNVVMSTFEDIRDPAEPAEFVVVEDRGLRDKNGNPLDQRIHADPTNSPYGVGVSIKNTGEVSDSRNIIVSIWDEELDELILTKEKDITLGSGETVDLSQKGANRTIQFQHNSEFDDKLETGETYAYTLEIETDEGTIENELDEPGTFYYGTSEPFFDLSNVSPSTGSSFATGNVTISGDVQQLGIDDTADSSAELDLEYLEDDHDTPEAYKNIVAMPVNGTSGATTPVAWTLNTSSMLQGEHQYTIDTGDENITKTFVVETGVDPGDTELYLESGNRVNVSILGTEISAESPTGEKRAKLVDGEKENGKWKDTGAGGWRYEWSGSQPNWNEDGGWKTDGDLECTSSFGTFCFEYDFVDSTEFWWDDESGWDLGWSESQGSDWAWTGDGDWVSYDVYEKQWAPVTVDLITQSVDEDGAPVGDRNVIEPDDWGTDGTSGDGSPESRNLNTHDTRDEIWEYSFTTDERVSLTLSSTLHRCGNYQLRDTDLYTDGEYHDYHDTWSEYNGNGIWDHYDCMNTRGESLNVDATTDSNNANVRVRDSVDNTVPELRAGHQRQHSADEVLERADRDLFGGELEDGTGYLDLKEGREFVFMFEVTDEAPSGMDPDEYWDQAGETDTPGDPNFNDVIVLVEVDGVPTDIGTPVPIDGGSKMVDTGLGHSDDDYNAGSGNNTETGVKVDTDHIVIG